MPVAISILAFIVAISVLVAVHEFGHFWVAKRLGFKVLRFSIGFGRPLWMRTAGTDRTEYVIAAIPLGGYVKLLDEREGPVAAAELDRSFTRRPVWQRLLVLSAGPAFNFLFAIVAYWVLFMWGVPQTHPVVGDVVLNSHAAQAGLKPRDEILRVGDQRTPDPKSVIFALLEDLLDDGRVKLHVRGTDGAERDVQLAVTDVRERHGLTEPGALLTGLGFDFRAPEVPPIVDKPVPDGPAEQAGVKSGDRVLAVDEHAVATSTEFRDYVSKRPGERVILTLRGSDGERNVAVTIRAEQEGAATVGRIGVELQRAELERLGPFAALGRASGETWIMSQLTVSMLWNMIMGRVSVKNISGPINIAPSPVKPRAVGLRPFLSSLPSSASASACSTCCRCRSWTADRCVYQLIEFAKGSPLSERAQVFGQQVGIAALLLLMSLAFYNDISSVF